MRIAFTIALIVLVTGSGRAQTVRMDSVNPLFRGEHDGERIRDSYDNFEPMMIQGKPKGPYNNIVLSIFHSKNLYTHTALNLKEHLKELDLFKLDLKRRQYYASMSNYPNVNAVPLFDSMPVIVTVYGINERNKASYRFRVLEDGQRELVSWSEPQLFSHVTTYFRYDADGSEEKQMAWLGEFQAPIGHSITVEVKNVMQPDTVFAISAIWIKRAPAVIASFGPGDLQRLIQVYKYQWKHDFFLPQGATYYGDIGLKPVDSLLKSDSVFDHAHDNLFLYLRDKIRRPELVEYRLIKDGDSSAAWQANSFDANVIPLQRLTPGKYDLLLRYAFQRQTVSKFSFRIKPAWYQTILFKVLLIAAALLFLALLYSFFKNRKQGEMLRQQQVKRQQAEIGLRSIRSQFNPHFVFNALNSIQGLVRKNDTYNADKYLSDFSRLMQESLRSGHREMVPLDKELTMLASYIELEKLRFKFQYTVVVTPRVNAHAIELPTLLVQPLIENAIKHGISGMYEKGILRVEIGVRGNDLHIAIIDNGKGFDPTAASGGFGILLTKERIQLLSDVHPGQPVTLNIDSGSGGTTVTIVFKNWLT